MKRKPLSSEDVKSLTQWIVAEARRLSSSHTNEKDAPVNYACIFAQSEEEYEHLIRVARRLGVVVSDTPTGPVFKIAALPTVAGPLDLLKIRRADPKRPERGDADFTVSDYGRFKKQHLGTPGFHLIQREHMEMIELIDPDYNVLAYYSNPPLGKVLGITHDPPSSHRESSD